MNNGLNPSPENNIGNESQAMLLSDSSFGEKLGKVKNTFVESWSNASVWGKGILFGAIGAQAYERFRIPEIIAPPLAIEVYMETGSAAKTGLALGGLVAAQQFVIGATWAEALTKYGDVADSVGDNFPKTVELAEDLGPEINRRWYSSVREGVSGFFTFGTTPFLIAKKTYEPEMSRKEAHKTAARVTTAIGITGVVFGKVAVEIIEELPSEYQDDVLAILEKPYLWIGLAALWEVPRFINKRVNRKQAKKLICLDD